MVSITADVLRSVTASAFESRGISQRDSRVIADSLVHANLRGIDSHGVMRVPHYVNRLETGSISARPNARLERTGQSTAVLDSDHGFGHVAVWDAMTSAVEIARESGIGLVGVSHSNHCGALSYPAYQAIDAGMIGLVMSQTDKGVVPVGGKEPFCGSNPLCFGIPSRSGPAIVLDMATSTVAGGHVYKARTENKPIPATWALDKDGEPTTDPHKGIYWTPAAGAKGYGLGVIVDVLTGILCGGTFGPHVVTMYGDLDKKRNLCHLVGAIDVSRFPNRGSFLDDVTRMVNELHAVKPREKNGRVLAPGEPEYLEEIKRSREGIPLEDAVWNDLVRLAPAETTGQAVGGDEWVP